nr:hypothetical protein [Tanacetum cinerariifolium]
MEVFYKTPTGKTISVELKDSDTFDTFKARLRQTKAGILNLFNRTSSLKPGSMQIFIKTRTGKIIPLNVSQCRFIEHVQSLLSEHVGVAPFEQGLYFVRIWLEDHHRTLIYYNIKQDSVLYFVPYFRGNIKIYLRKEDSCGCQICPHCQGTESPCFRGNIKIYRDCCHRNNRPSRSGKHRHHQKHESQDSRQGRYSRRQAYIVFPQKQLQDDFTLADYCIWNGTTVHLIQNLG